MPLYASWAHGNALTCQSPSLLAPSSLGHGGWGGDFSLQPGKSSWFHIPIPTPVLIADARAQFQLFYLLFEIPGGGRITQVHIYDGAGKIQEFDGLNLTGAHRTLIDGANKFTLSSPHSVAWGIGITFAFTADIGFDSAVPPSRLLLGSAGVDFFV